jgi:hypothetical protein
MQTALSLSSSLNLDYLSDLPKKMTDRGMLRGLIKYNRVKTLLEKLGYKTVFFASNYLPTDVPEANIYLSSPNVSSAHYLDSLLIYNSVAIIPVENHWLDLPMARFNQQHERVQYTLERVSNLSDIPGPKFVFAHITAPHPPFVFDSHGPINSDQVFYLFDGDTSFTSDQNYIDGYIEQMTYINHQVLTMLDGILANSKTPPIIILQGDHGPGAYWDNMSAERTCLKERFSILNAYHLPDHGNNNLYASISPVNTFRVIFNTYFNTDFDILENRNYFSLWNQPYGFIDVTGKTETECKIP